MNPSASNTSASNTSALRTWHWTHGDDSAPLLLCLHGIGSCADAFVGQQALAGRSGMRVAAWDAPGYRNSPDPDVAPGIDGFADAAADLIRELGHTSATVLGVSWGGVTATRLVLRHPELVDRLVIVDSSVGSGTTPEQAEAMRGRSAALEDLGLEAFARSRAPVLLSDSAPAELVDQAAQMMIDALRMPNYQWACDSMAEADHRSQLPDISCPTLVVVGSADVVTPPERSQQLAEGIPGAKLVTIPGVGHISNQEDPAAVNNAVAAFLADNPLS